ncbi:MAG: energy transducer TonB [Fimbriimonadaceae bacterium]|nr:energy transducer TonB [Chitinophagales bacterium]
MNTSKNYFAQTMDDIIFENRNKKYGAYILRKNNDRYITRGLVFVLFIVTALSVYSITKKIPLDVKDLIVLKPEKIIEVVFPDKQIELPKQTQQQEQIIERSNTEDFREVVAVIDTAAPNEPVTPNEKLEGKTIGTKTDSTGIGQSVNPLANNNGNTGAGNPDAGKTKNDFVFVADVMPVFENMDKWLSKNIKYPRAAVEAGVEGKVHIEFIVNTDGTISDAKVVRGIGFGCDEEALNAIKKMPKWKPGAQQGNPVRVKMTKPVLFKINK